MSIESRDLLIEIGTEELPPKALHDLACHFSHQVREQLTSLGLYTEDNAHELYCSPRRLALVLRAVHTAQPDRPLERHGPAVNIAFNDNGQPTKAAEGFARSCGTTVDQLQEKDGKLFYSGMTVGQLASGLLPDIIRTALHKLPIPKRMRWGEGSEEFVRPVHWLVLLFGDQVVECDMLGVSSGRTTHGHRYHHPGPLELKQPSDYVQALREARVWLNDAEGSLKHEISHQVNRLADELNGRAINAEPDSELVAENAALVEWPVALAGSFDTGFLALPEEVLIATLEDQQRYFAVRTTDGEGLAPHFIAISNIESKQPERVREGNERVVVPRLADAMFFWESDRAVKLATRMAELDDIVFQSRLGSVGDKMRRVRSLAEHIAEQTGSNTKHAMRAAELAKCDLLSHLVGEFPKLQGTIGRYLAAHDSEAAEVATAIEEHYRPRFAGDAPPATGAGRAVAIADKLDTIIGIFAIGQAPTGEKDPFGLRRAALGVLRTLIECRLELDLEQLIQQSASSYPADIQAGTVHGQVFEFMMERLRHYYLDQGVAIDTFEAVLARRPGRPLDFHQRLLAVEAFRRLPEAESLAAANKRIMNILKQASGPVNGAVRSELLQDAAEQQLARELDTISYQIEPLLARSDYTAALTRLAGLRDSIDNFFDHVMVMCDDQVLRDNRLALLNHLSNLFQRTADISRLQG